MGNCRKERQRGREEEESRKGKKKEERRKEEREEERAGKQNKSVWGRLSGHVTATLSGMHVHCLTQEHHSFPLQTLVLLLPSFVVKPEQWPHLTVSSPVFNQPHGSWRCGKSSVHLPSFPLPLTFCIFVDGHFYPGIDWAATGTASFKGVFPKPQCLWTLTLSRVSPSTHLLLRRGEKAFPLSFGLILLLFHETAKSRLMMPI